MRIVGVVLSAAVAATAVQAPPMLTETYSVSFFGVVDNLGTNALPGAQVGDSISGWFTFRTERIDPGPMNVFAGIIFAGIRRSFRRRVRLQLERGMTF